MPQAISPSQRALILEIWRGELSVDQAAAQLGVTRRTLKNLQRRYLQSKLPAAREPVLAPLAQPVIVLRDRWGVAHLEAQSTADCFTALGYAMAQDRLWQMDYMRRLAHGQLAAILGAERLPQDRLHRTIGLTRAAQAAATAMNAEETLVLQALASGINAWIEQAGDRLPLEFELLEYAPEPWTVMDSIAIWKWRWWMLTGRLAGFAVEEAAKRFVPPELLDAFFSSEAGEETIVPGDEPAWRGGDDTGEGSNNWVVGGSRTVNGKPILASDPHNEVSLARQWYQAQVTAPGMDAIGAFFLGTPGIYLGHNRCTAWGVTNHGASVRDLYVEKTSPADPDQYRDGEHWRPFEEDRQEVAVRGRPAEALVVRRTVRGPLVHEFVPGLESASPLSMRWRGAEPTTGFQAMLGLMRSRNVAQIETALAQWPMPILNFVYADVEGAIGYHAAGQVPRRKVQTLGVRPANDPECAWSSPYPFHELPKLSAPQRDWVVTANNAPWGGDRPYLRSGSWADGYRFRRIRESIEQTDRHTLASVAAIQADIVHARARELAPRVAEIALAARQRQLRRLGALLRDWNGAYAVESVAATVFAVFWELWVRRVARARFPASAVPMVAGRTGSIACRVLLSGDGGEWFPEKVDIPSEVRRTLLETLSWLREHVGRRTSQWRWGRLHTVTFRHPLSDGGPRSELFDVGPFAASGGSGTVRATGYSFAAPFAVTGLSTYRLVVDLADPAHALATSAGGQSGHPGSPHYRTQSELWVADHYHPLLMDRQEVEANLLD